MKPNCPICGAERRSSGHFGHFTRMSDKRRFRRYRCHSCARSFSDATYQLCYRQKKRRLNRKIFELLCSGMSQRRIAKYLKISRTTVSRKLIFLARVKRHENLKDLQMRKGIEKVQFDDLETIEHTKCKPLSVTMAVEKHSRKILGFSVSRMPAKGHLAKKARQKYGPRTDERPYGRERLFARISPHIAAHATIESDQNPHYPRTIKKWCPHAKHLTTKGQRGSVAGQGELKKVTFDPLFTLNHSFAMFRANINRLFRKTWCTTKLPERLCDHIELYVNYHNRVILKS